MHCYSVSHFSGCSQSQEYLTVLKQAQLSLHSTVSVLLQPNAIKPLLTHQEEQDRDLRTLSKQTGALYSVTVQLDNKSTTLLTFLCISA